MYEEKKADLLLIDEHKGRSVARKMAVEHIGTVGILMLAFDENLLTKDEVLESLKVLLAFDIRLSRKLCNKVLHYVGTGFYHLSKTFDSIKRNYRRRFSILKENRRHVCLTYFSAVCLSFLIYSYTRSWNQTPDCRYRSSSDPVFPATAAALHRTSGSVPLHVAARSGSDRRLRDL